jgi:hypothetical protein
MLNDTDKMPFGKHKGKQLSHVPDEYLLWLHGELEIKCSPFARPLKEYLDENLEAIKQNVSQKYPKPFCND